MRAGVKNSRPNRNIAVKRKEWHVTGHCANESITPPAGMLMAISGELTGEHNEVILLPSVTILCSAPRQSASISIVPSAYPHGPDTVGVGCIALLGLAGK
jgi:hypothetical protein